MSTIFACTALTHNVNFGAGLVEIDLAEIAFAAKLAEIESDARMFARIDARKAAERKVAADVIDRAWKNGLDAGLAGLAAAPSRTYSDAERIAFAAGFDQGTAEYRDDERDAIEATLAALELENAPLDLHEMELNEARMVA